MIERALGDVQRRIMELLTSTGEASLSEITKRIGLSKPSVFRHLKGLLDLGLVACRAERTTEGREMRYSLNRHASFLMVNPEARAVLAIETHSAFSQHSLLLEQVKDEEFKEDLRILHDAISRMKKAEQPLTVILFGSVAERKGTWKSDIDVALIRIDWSRESRSKAEALISEVNMKTKHPVKPQFLEKSAFENRSSTLIEEMKASGIIIFGDLMDAAIPWREMKRYKSITPSA